MRLVNHMSQQRDTLTQGERTQKQNLDALVVLSSSDKVGELLADAILNFHCNLGSANEELTNLLKVLFFETACGQSRGA